MKKLRHERGADISLTGAGEAHHAAVAGPLPPPPRIEDGASRSSVSSARRASARRRSAQSIARAMGRKFVRISLGGMHDEAEIRGHRRTYVGAMPGRFIQALSARRRRRPGVHARRDRQDSAPDFRGDPSAALLEVLDPAQNHTFVDNYLERAVRSVARAVHLHGEHARHDPAAAAGPHGDHPLAGYTRGGEARRSRRRYLLPSSSTSHGLDAERDPVHGRGARRIIRDYTREAGVRNLEREIAAIMPQGARGRSPRATRRRSVVDAENVDEFLGPPRYSDERRRADRPAGRRDRPGVDADGRRRAVHRGDAACRATRAADRRPGSSAT